MTQLRDDLAERLTRYTEEHEEAAILDDGVEELISSFHSYLDEDSEATTGDVYLLSWLRG